MSYIYIYIRQDMVYKSSSILTKSTIIGEMPFPRQPILLKMKLGIYIYIYTYTYMNMYAYTYVK
jgi:hypothetical protein